MSINEANIDFVNGVTLISGKNGLGKSAPIDAIAICLTEYRRSDTFLDYIQKGSTKVSAYIQLWADFNGEELFFDISINKEKGNTFQRSITYKGKVYQMAEASELIRTLDLSYYSNIILAMQDSEDITKLSPTQRANYLQKLLNFDFSNYIKIIDDEIKTHDSNKQYLETQIRFQTNEISTRKTEIKAKEPLPFAESEYQDLIVKKNSIAEQILAQHNKILESADLVNDKTKLLTERLDIEKKLSSIEDQRQKLAKYESTKIKLSDDIAHHNLSAKSIQTKLASCKEAYAKASNANRELTDKLNQYEKDSAVVSEQIKVADKMVALAQKGVCPECGQPTANIEIGIWLTNRASLLLQKTSAQSSISTIEESIKLNKKTIETNHPEISVCERQLAVTLANAKRLDAELLVLEKPEEQTDDSAALEANLLDTNAKLAAIEEKLSVEKDQAATINRLKSTELELTRNISVYEKTVQQNTFIATHNQEVEEAIKKLENEIEKQKLLIADINKNLTLRNEAKNLIDKKLSNYLIVKTCASLESEMNQFIQIVFPLMEVRLYQNKKGVEFFYTTDKTKITSKTEKNDLINVKMASGFQKELLSIAFRVALCKAYSLSLLILDECDKAASDEASEKLFDTLLNESNFQQMLIITHKPTIKDMILAVAPVYKTYTPQNGIFYESE